MKQKKDSNWYFWLKGTQAMNVNIETTDKVDFERHDLRREKKMVGREKGEVVDRRVSQCV